MCIIFGVGALARPNTPDSIKEPVIVPEKIYLETPIETQQEEIVPSLFDQLSTEAKNTLAEQQKVDALLANELNANTYTFENPLIIINPYGNSPLTALALFETEEPATISVRVPGKTEVTDVTFDFPDYKKHHIIPIYGLYPDILNMVEITSVRENGATISAVLELQTEPLPKPISDLTIITDLRRPDLYQDGFNFCFFQKRAYDAEGYIRWYLNDFTFLQAQQTNYNGHLLLTKGSLHHGATLIYEMDYLGRIYNVYYSPYGAHHDIFALENGNLLVTGSDIEAFEAIIYEIDKTNGEIITLLDFSEILPRTRIISPYFNNEDWLHINSIVSDGDGNIVVSGRNQSAVLKLSWPEGKIDWVFSFHDGWPEMFKKHLLKPIGDNFEWPLCQHNPTILPDYDNNSDTIDILIFDNGIDRFSLNKELQRKILRGEATTPELYSRIVHYRINEKTRTVQQIWQFGNELGKTYFSQLGGNAELLSTGSFFAAFPGINQIKQVSGTEETIYNTSCFEVSKSGEIIWESYIADKTGSIWGGEYRTVRATIYTDRDNDYSLDIIPNNFVPEKEVAQ